MMRCASSVSTTDDQMLRFVIQKHAARTLHYDFRLERNGVFKSWVVPKGIPDAVGVKRLAIQVDDHDLAFGEFEGEIPEGEYGSGTVEIWDRGTYQDVDWTDTRITVHLKGTRVVGTFVLERFPSRGDEDWLVSLRGTDTKCDNV